VHERRESARQAGGDALLDEAITKSHAANVGTALMTSPLLSEKDIYTGIENHLRTIAQLCGAAQLQIEPILDAANKEKR
jgi:hypothetical protein